MPWVAASGVEGVESITLRGLKRGNYCVRLCFANPTRERRCFDIRLQGQMVSEDFTLTTRLVSVAPVFDGIVSEGSLRIDLRAKKGTTQLSGVEIMPARVAH